MIRKACAIALLAFAIAATGVRADEFTKEDLKKWDGAFSTVVKEGEAIRA